MDISRKKKGLSENKLGIFQELKKTQLPRVKKRGRVIWDEDWELSRGQIVMCFESQCKGFNATMRIQYIVYKQVNYIWFVCLRNYFEQGVDYRGARSEAGYCNGPF